MRYSIGEPKRRPQAHAKRHRRRNRRSTFHAAVALPVSPTSRRQHAERTSNRRARVEAASPTKGTMTAVSWAAVAMWFRQVPARRWWSLLIVGMLAASIGYISTDSRFYVYSAQIQGAHHLRTDAVYAAAGIDMQSIFWIDPQRVAQKLIQVDGIRAAHVRCRLPARVVINIEEREPIVMWRALHQGRDWWVDADGVVLPYHGDPDSPQTLFVVDSSERELEVGDRIQPEGIVQSVSQLADALPGARVFYYGADRGLSFTQQSEGSQWPVYLGTGDDLPRKIQVVEVLTSYLEANEIQPSYVDVRWADRPLYGKPSSQTGGGGQ